MIPGAAMVTEAAMASRAKASITSCFTAWAKGRITRLWMTDNYDDARANDWKELWIQIDGQTVFRGSPLDFSRAKGRRKPPLVLDYNASSGGFLSYVPFPYAHEAKVLMLGEPHYTFHVTYRQGAGSSAGPTAEALPPVS